MSTLTENKSDVRKAANFVAAGSRRIGLEHVEKFPTKGHPRFTPTGSCSRQPTVLCYAHDDVQPPVALDEWMSPPFEPTERNNNIYARGAVTTRPILDGGQSHEALMKGHNGKLPLNVKFIMEGEEEVGGESSRHMCGRKKPKLKADFALVCDTELFSPIFRLCALVCAVWSTRRLKPSGRKLICTPGCTAARRRIHSSG